MNGTIGNGRFTIGDLLHMIEIAMLFISLGVSYEKFEQTRAQVEVHTQSLDRIEHYLSSKDAKYWKLSKQDQ